MTCEEFVDGCARRSGMTVPAMYSHGMVPLACHCEEEDCQGWQVVGERAIPVLLELGHVTQEEIDEAWAFVLRSLEHGDGDNDCDDGDFKSGITGQG